MKRDQIKDRILKRAARVWGFSGIEMESSFDPLVSLMINALSEELEQISYGLQDINTSVVERILEIMFPEASIGARPAQAILHASPLENNVKVSLLNELTANKRILNIYNPLEPIIKEIAFSPTLDVQLADCNLKYVAYGRNLYEVSNVLEKKVVEDYHNGLSSGEVFLGLELSNPNVLELDNLMLYVNIKDIQQKEILHYYLKNIKCFYDDIPIKIEAGYNVAVNNPDIANLNNSSLHLSEIIKEVNEFYFDNFYTLKGILKYKTLQNYNLNHEGFNQINSINDKPIIWIKMIFPESLIPQILDNVTFQVNCFPVINKKRHTITKTIKDKLSYLALDTDQSIYLDIENVIGSFNNYYEIKEFKDSAIKDGTAVLRRSGTSKFDQRSATELIQNVLDLLKDEGSSFSSIGKDFASQSLGKISQLLSSIEEQTDKNSTAKNKSPYLMIKPSGEETVNESFDINYWSTCAEEGNDIKEGTVLEPQDKLFDANKPVVLITTTVGGSSKQNDQDRIFFYRDALLTRGRIVTIADIKALSFNHFKSCISAVRIEKGTRKEISIKEGFSRTVDIYLMINKSEKEKLSTSEWDYLYESFIKHLKNKSSNIFPYRLFEEI